jgi:hypothetical protein
MFPFIRDIICLSEYTCLLGQMKTVLAMMQGLQLQFDVARSAAFELVDALQCAQGRPGICRRHDAGRRAHRRDSRFDRPMMGLVGQSRSRCRFPAARAVEALSGTIQTVQGVVEPSVVVEALGGCGS